MGRKKHPLTTTLLCLSALAIVSGVHWDNSKFAPGRVSHGTEILDERSGKLQLRLTQIDNTTEDACPGGILGPLVCP